ncbi:PAS domain-containing protein [Caulobacter sp. DWR2-3-1b2]|uniref:PAS domain-containing protein n=1 Tax=unclassified Caulobacter TaxID=2648921 RepID=UPI003CF93CC6
MDTGVVLTDEMLGPPGPHILYVNTTFERMTGFNRDEIVGKDPRIFQGRGPSLAARKLMARALRAGERRATTLVNYRKSGGAYLCSIEVFPLLDPDGVLVNVVALEREVERRPGRHPSYRPTTIEDERS